MPLPSHSPTPPCLHHPGSHWSDFYSHRLVFSLLELQMKETHNIYFPVSDENAHFEVKDSNTNPGPSTYQLCEPDKVPGFQKLLPLRISTAHLRAAVTTGEHMLKRYVVSQMEYCCIQLKTKIGCWPPLGNGIISGFLKYIHIYLAISNLYITIYSFSIRKIILK